jgi:hypothetical protein
MVVAATGLAIVDDPRGEVVVVIVWRCRVLPLCGDVAGISDTREARTTSCAVMMRANSDRLSSPSPSESASETIVAMATSPKLDGSTYEHDTTRTRGWWWWWWWWWCVCGGGGGGGWGGGGGGRAPPPPPPPQWVGR